MHRVLIIPAAGPGSRLHSSVPKLLFEINGRALVDYLLDRYKSLVDRVLLVVSPGALADVQDHCAGHPHVEIAIQHAPTGMLDAVLAPYERVRALAPRQIWITWGDQIGVRPDTASALARAADANPDAALIFPTLQTPQPYIHFERDVDGRIARVLHRRERDAMPAVGENDVGLFSLSADAYIEWLPRYAATGADGAATGERNFLPFIPWLAARARVETIAATDAIEALGVNTPEDAARLGAWLLAQRG